MADFTVQYIKSRLLVAMPAIAQGDGDPGYSAADVRAELREQRDQTVRAVARRGWAFTL